MRLSDLKPGERGRVVALENGTAMKRRLQELGMVRDTVVECVGRSPLGDPSAYLLRKTVIALRQEDASDIQIREVRP